MPYRIKHTVKFHVDKFRITNKFGEIIIIVAALSVILTSYKLAYGQNNATSYRIQLEAYINLHNISFSAANGGNHLNISNLDLVDLETSVQSHMQFCKSNYNIDERIRSQQIRGTDWAIRVHRILAFGDC